MDSSYKENNFSHVFTSTVIMKKAGFIVEFGVLHGYSTIALGFGAKFVEETYNIESFVKAYDLFDDYPFNHGSMEEVQKTIDQHNLTGFIDLEQANVKDIVNDIKDNCIDVLHVDISNTGETLEWVIDKMTTKLTDDGIILFEGGSEERDKIDWMARFGKTPIRDVLTKNKRIKNEYGYFVFPEFPSLTVLCKKGKKK